MSSLLLAVSVGAAALLGPVFGTVGRGAPPRPFSGEDAVLPGKPPSNARALRGKWAFGHYQRDVVIEAGRQDALVSGLYLFFNENGTYELHYHARWDLPSGLGSGGSMDGVNADETGHYSVSGDILLLEPKETFYSELKDNAVVNARQPISNENRAYVVSLDKSRLHIAGRCAKYQVEPVCKEARDVWFVLGAQAGRRWLGMGPR